MRRKMIKYVLVIFVIIVMFSILIEFLNPLRRSDEKIREEILDVTPIGSSIEDVIRVIENKKNWKWNGRVQPNGFSKTIAGRPTTVVGSQSIRVFVGEYRNIFATTVTVFWGFNENSKLIDVWVWKTTDVP